EGIVPQTLTVQFGYFAGLQSWAPILIPVFFFLLGNVVRPLIEGPVKRIGRSFFSRIHFGREVQPDRESGVVLSREELAKIVPGETTRDQVLQIAGGAPEEFEQLTAPDRRTLIFRGRRVVPRPGRVPRPARARSRPGWRRACRRARGPAAARVRGPARSRAARRS